MHPGFFGWWKRGHGPSSCGPGGGHWGGGPPWGGGHGHGHGHGGGQGDHDDGGGFGVKRPLRFLAWKLELEEDQVKKLATILDDLKTERAQAAVDNRRSIGAFAEAVEGATFDEAKARAGGDTRVASAEKLRDAVVRALGKLHELLDDEQRKRLAYLLRTGTLAI